VIEDILSRAEPFDDADTLQLHNYYFGQLSRFASRQGAADPEGAANLALFDGFRAQSRRAIVDEPAFRSYLYRATKSHLLNESRRRVPVPTGLIDDGPDCGGERWERADRVSSIEPSVEQVVEQEWLSAVFSQLPEDHQKVLTMRVVEGLSAEEAGRELDRAPNAVYQLQHRAQQRLRNLVLLALAALLAIAGAFLVVSRNSPSSRTITPAPVDRPQERFVTSEPLPTAETAVSVPAVQVDGVVDLPSPADDGSTSASAEPVPTSLPTEGGTEPSPSPSSTTAGSGAAVTTSGSSSTTAAAPAAQSTVPSAPSNTVPSAVSSTVPSAPSGSKTVPSAVSSTVTALPGSSTAPPAPSTTRALANTTVPTTSASTTTTSTAPIGGSPNQVLNTCRVLNKVNGLYVELYDPALAEPDDVFNRPWAVRVDSIDALTGLPSTRQFVTSPNWPNPGWITADGTATFDRPSEPAVWTVRVGQPGTEFVGLSYEIEEQWYEYEGCPG
jgi:RNA polymerase sigma factor (sigma-70 family)